MTDDAELRARIEAQVAARRADAASSEPDESPATHTPESAPEESSARAGKGLTPTRPWQRRGTAEGVGATPDEQPDVESVSAGARRGGVGPARPWARRSAAAHDDPPREALDGTSVADSADGRLHPARPWQGRPAAETSNEGTTAPAPSHPHVVLHGIGEEDAGGTPEPPPRMRGLLQRGIGKRRGDDAGSGPERGNEDDRGAATRDLAKRRAEAESRLAAEREEAERALAAERAAAEQELADQRAAAERELAELRAERDEAERVLAERRAAMEELPESTAVYVPDDEAVGAFAEAAGALQDQPVDDADDTADQAGRWARRKRKPKDAPITASGEDVTELTPVAESASATREVGQSSVTAVDESAPVADEPVAAAVPPVGEDVPTAADEQSYPWQQRDEVDLDLHGAPTWDPGMYPPEDEAQQQRRGRRALRWLLARAPEPPVEDVPAPAVEEEATPEPAAPAAYEPEPRIDLPVAHLPVDDIISREAPPVADEPAAAAEQVPEPEPVEPVAEATAEPTERKRVGLFDRLRRRAGDEEEEPDEAFALPPVDEAWLEPPKPTRDWAQRTAPIELGATPDEIAAVVPQPAAEPAQEPEPEPVAATAEPVAVEPDPTGVGPELAAAEAEPAAAVEPEPAPIQPEPEVRRRPSPGAAAAPRRPSPGVAAAAAPAATGPAAAEPAAGARRRPSPGVAAATASETGTGRPMPFELAGGPAAPTTSGVQAAPDISRFLEATEADEDDDEDEDERPRRGGGDGRWKKTLTRTGVTLLIAALAAVLLRVFIVQPYYIPSASMEPTLHGCPGCNDDHVLVDKISYDVHGVRVGDIVVFHKPDNAQVPEDVLIKRVIALGGDRISMRHGRVYINGGLLEETYLNKDHSCYATDPSENFGPETVPSGKVFVMGDNRCNSEDSREFGPISTSSIIGRAFMIVWPLDRVRFLGS